MPFRSRRMPLAVTDSPSVVSPPPRHVTGMRVALRDAKHLGDVLGGTGMDDRIRKAVHDLAAVGPVTGARGAIGAEQHVSMC